MVHFEKTFSEEIEMALEREKKKKSGKYALEIVIEQLRHDFENKCYICEQKDIAIEIEHFIPHKKGKNINLKFDWKNLFLVCHHCNNIKLAKTNYNQILNCTNPEHKVTEWIEYKLNPIPKLYVEVVATYLLENSNIIQNTVDLLHEVYNKENTPNKKGSTENLKKWIFNELTAFANLLTDYYSEEIEEDDKKVCYKRIQKHLQKTSAFTAFKHWIIYEND